MRLKPRSERKLSADQIIQVLRTKTAGVIGIKMFMQNLPPIRIGGILTKSLYQYTLQGQDLRELYQVAPQLEAKLRELPGLQDVTTDLQIKSPQVQVDLDRDRIATLGLGVDLVENTLYYAYGTRQVSTIYAPNNEYEVILGVKREYQQNPNALSMLYLRAPGGPLVPLDTVVLERAAEPFPTLLSSLDAIHLATALLARTQVEDLCFATHDGELATAARAVGFKVLGGSAKGRRRPTSRAR